MADSAIPATTPTTVNATFGNWAFTTRSLGDGLVSFGSSGPQPPIRFEASGVKFRTRADGVQERSPLLGDTVTLVIPDLYAAAAQYPFVASALQGLLAAIQQYGQATGQL